MDTLKKYINIKDNNNNNNINTIFTQACIDGNKPLIELLVDLIDNLNIKENINILYKNNHHDMIYKLVDCATEENKIPDDDFETLNLIDNLLHSNYFTLTDHTIDNLIMLGADINFSDWDNKNILTIACNFYPNQLEEIISRGGNVNSIERYKTTGLMILCHKRDQTKNIKLMIDKGCDVNFQDRDGWTALMISVTRNIDAFKILVECSDINIVNNNKENVLFILMRNPKLELIKLLLNKGLNPHILNNDGENVLFNCVNKKLFYYHDERLQSLEFLLDVGVNPHIKNKYNNTILDIVKKDKLIEIVGVLNKYKIY